MIPTRVETADYPAILRNNAQFVHWLSPLDMDALTALLERADYARQLEAGEAVAIAYAGDSDYRHKNVDWLSARLSNYLYIDRVIVGEAGQGQGLGRRLYEDLAVFAREQGHRSIACEVNIIPDNSVSHAFHLSQGYEPLGDLTYPNGAAVRYYVRKLQD